MNGGIFHPLKQRKKVDGWTNKKWKCAGATGKADGQKGVYLTFKRLITGTMA
jgi:hypothetical protein